MSFFFAALDSLGYFVRTPSTAVEEETDCSISALRSFGSLRNGLVSFNDFLRMINFNTNEGYIEGK
jgi:hypothetical protein